MLSGFEGREHLLINALGHTAGTLVFGNFLFLLLWNRPARRAYTSNLAFVAAALALLWNLASLGALLSGENHEVAARLIAAIAFSALSLLPAVLLHLCLVDKFPSAVRLGYVVSGAAVVAHVLELTRGAAVYHRFGLIIITAGFGLITVISVLRILWSGTDIPRTTSSRLFAAMSLFLFAISFIHFSDGESHNAWSTELVFHHAGIPLALLILIQDYRFVFLDAFIRFVANGLLGGIFALAMVESSARLSPPGQVIAASVVLASFGVTRGLALRFLSRIVFREVDADKLTASLSNLETRASTEREYIREAFDKIAAAMSTRVMSISDLEPESGALLLPVLTAELPDARELRSKGIEVLVPVRRGNMATEVISLGERRSGRRYLSRDLETLVRLTAYVAHHAEIMRESEMRRLATEAELRALQAQIHPHFLFNAMNTLYGVIPRQATEAREVLLSLSEILRYFLQSERTYIPLAEELRVVRAYLSIEQLRLGPKLRTKLDIEEGLAEQLIPVLSVEPLVENAVKHGIAPWPEGGEVRVEVRRLEQHIRIEVHDSGPGFVQSAEPSPEHAGIGLKNVSRRLELCYGRVAHLDVQTKIDGTSVSFEVPVTTVRARGIRDARSSAVASRRSSDCARS
jgi:two-component system, LytTR family, sensor kinase